MNKILLQQTGGFPLETDTLDYMQTAYAQLQAIAALGGDNYILSGCVATGGSTGNGVVVLAGEVLEFRGGITQASIVIREDRQSRPFENGQVKEVFITRYATFGTGAEAIAWNTISKLKNLSLFKNLPTSASSAINLDDEQTLATSKAVKLLNDKIESNLPTGCILIWSGSINSIPIGFALCDGSNGRPDLRDRFVLGAGLNYSVAAIGGEKEHRLTIDEMPSHSHGYTAPRNDQNVDAGGNSRYGAVQGGTTTSTGGNLPHNNMPPYYTLAYIIKL
ncbi:hypothetical protein [Pedobacter sp. ASV28]|uniref:hypothetical protein n=1 Tax=Pedobacter sp. ASV28 TaxID=2795123 RepID=UPI0018EB3E06|nr:hypothetical protein [Pedobacter sp. ASV28]